MAAITSTTESWNNHKFSEVESHIKGSYLKLGGGTMTGSLTIDGGADLNLKAATNTSDTGDLVFKDGAGTEVGRIWLNDGFCVRYSSTESPKTIIHSGNISSQSVNYATSAGNSDTCDGLHVHSGRNNEANKIVRTDGNGHIQCGYINSSGDEANNSSPARVWGTNGSDSYMRTYLTSALSVNTANRVGDGMNYIYCTSNEVNFGGTYNTETIEFGATAKDSKPKPTAYKFGGSNASAVIYCSNIYTPNISSTLIGSGTYTTMRWGLYSDHYEFEFPNLTDSSSGTHIPIYFGWRGGVYPLTINSDCTLTTNAINFSNVDTRGTNNGAFRMGRFDEPLGGLKMQFGSGGTKMEIINSGWTIALLSLDASGNLTANGGITSLSDARHKKVIGDVSITVEQIATMPSVLFKWTDNDHDDKTYAGTIAQDWEGVLPEVISHGKNEEGTLSLNYGVAALVSSITTARDVVSIKEKIKSLEDEIAKLKEKL